MKMYAVYKGDKFIDCGTIGELSRKLGISRDTLKWYTYPAYKKRTEGKENTIVVVTFNYEEE